MWERHIRPNDVATVRGGVVTTKLTMHGIIDPLCGHEEGTEMVDTSGLLWHAPSSLRRPRSLVV